MLVLSFKLAGKTGFNLVSPNLLSFKIDRRYKRTHINKLQNRFCELAYDRTVIKLILFS